MLLINYISGYSSLSLHGVRSGVKEKQRMMKKKFNWNHQQELWIKERKAVYKKIGNEI